MIYLLDTDCCIYTINGKYPQISDEIRSRRPNHIKISVITVSELMYGCYKSKFPKRNTVALKEFLSPFEIINFNIGDAVIYGNIRAKLETKGQVIGHYDMQIAAQAINRNYTVITNNVREFNRIDNLKIDNWMRKVNGKSDAALLRQKKFTG